MFSFYNRGKQISLDKIFEDIPTSREVFYLHMNYPEEIPVSSIFIIKIQLESGIELISEGSAIRFL